MCNENSNYQVIVSPDELFINLHVHSNLSILDSLPHPKDLVTRAKEMNQSAIAITEHGNLFSSIKMYKECEAQGIKYIHGCEVYISPTSRFEKDKDNKYNHMTILAKNEQGRLNLNKLVTKGYLEGFYSKPRIDFDLLKEHKDGLIVLSGCMLGIVQQTLAGGKIGDKDDIEITEKSIQETKKVIKHYREVFKDDYYLEIQSHRDIKQQKLNRVIVNIAKEMGIEFVATADTHMTKEEDFELHKIFIEIGQSREANETYLDCHLQSESDVMRLLMPTLTEEESTIAVRTTRLIADKCNVNIPLSAPLIPHVDIPFEYKNEEEYIKDLINKGWKERKINSFPKEKRKVYQERLTYEFNAVKEMGFIGYFLLVYSYVNSVQRRGIARGSGGGCLIAYLLNIVDIDPVKYGLYFERFIDVGQLDLLREGVITPKERKIPDVDSDFGKKDREKVVQTIEKKYTKERFASLGQFGYIWDKSAIKDIGRVLSQKGAIYYNQLDFNILNNITKDLNDLTIQEAREEGYTQKWEKKYPQLFKYAEKLAGIPRSFGVHPCGKAITIDDLTYYHALAENEGHLVFQMDMNDAEDLGIVKVDLLGLRTIDVIYDVLEMIGKTYREYLDPAILNFEDNRVYEEVFQNGFTDGVFQFESQGMKQTLQKMKPTSLDDLGVANALYRPSAMKYIDTYIKRKHGEETFEYLHPDLESVLKPTYGIMVFQEQLIEIGRLAKMRNPDKLRKATGKKKPKLLAECRDELIKGLVQDRGWSEEQFEQLWKDMLDFAKYSFNKSHSYAYAIIAYICGFLKVYHSKEFITALFNSFDGKPTRFEGVYQEAKRLDVIVNSIDFNNPTPYCTLIDGKINYGLKLVKHCNLQMADDLSRLKDNNYNTFMDLLWDISETTSIDSRQMNILISLDFFRNFGEKELIKQLYNEFKNGKGVFYKRTHSEKTKIKRIELRNELEQSLRYVFNSSEKHSIYNQLELEKEYYGFMRTTNQKADENTFAIVDINDKYTPLLYLYSLKTGAVIKLKVKKKKFYNEIGYPQLYVGDIVTITGTSEEGKWYMDEDGKFKQNNSIQESYLQTCKLVERSLETSK